MSKKLTSSLLTQLTAESHQFDYIQSKKSETHKVFRFMRGFFYSNANGIQSLKKNVVSVLTDIFPVEMGNNTIQIINEGSEWVQFKGGAPVQRQSHYWIDVAFPIDFTVEK